MNTKVSRPRSYDLTLIDAASLFDACDAIANRLGRTKITLDYSKLRERLDILREGSFWRPASRNAIQLSIDPSSEGQQRFLAMLKHAGFESDIVHYRDTFVSAPPGRNPNEMSSKPIVSFAARIAYIAGLMAHQSKTQLLVVSHSFELFAPLEDLARRLRDEGKVGIAYFGSLLDYRWKAEDVFAHGYGYNPHAEDKTLVPPNLKPGIKFFDLDPYCQELLGVEFAAPRTQSTVGSGLNRF